MEAKRLVEGLSPDGWPVVWCPNCREAWDAHVRQLVESMGHPDECEPRTARPAAGGGERVMDGGCIYCAGELEDATTPDGTPALYCAECRRFFDRDLADAGEEPPEPTHRYLERIGAPALPLGDI